MRYLFLVLALSACAVSPAPHMTDAPAAIASDSLALRREAYTIAVGCLPKGQRAAKRLQDIQFEIVQHPYITIHDAWSETVHLSAWWDPTGSVIWIARPWATNRDVLAHELLHAVLGVQGHPYEFDHCHLEHVVHDS